MKIGLDLYSSSSSSAGGVTTVKNTDGTLTISPTSGAVVASLNLGNANTWTTLQTFNGYVALPLGDSAAPYTPSFTFANFADGTVGSVLYASDTGGIFNGLDELDILASYKNTITTIQPTILIGADQTLDDFLAITGTSTTVNGSAQWVSQGNLEINYGGSGTGTYTIGQGASRTPIITANSGATPVLTINATGGIILEGFIAAVNNAASGADMAIYGNAATVTSGTNIETLSLYTEGGERVGIEMTGNSTSANMSIRSIVSVNDKMTFNVGSSTNNTLMLGDAAGHPNKVTTQNNTLDDGSGNVATTGKITKYNNVSTAGQGVAAIYASASNTELTTTGATSIAAYTPGATGNCLLYAYYRVVTGTTTVTLTATWTDETGAQTYTWVNAVSEPTGSYTVVPLFVHSTAAAITITATAGTANQVYVSANIVQLA